MTLSEHLLAANIRSCGEYDEDCTDQAERSYNNNWAHHIYISLWVHDSTDVDFYKYVRDVLHSLGHDLNEHGGVLLQMFCSRIYFPTIPDRALVSFGGAPWPPIFRCRLHGRQFDPVLMSDSLKAFSHLVQSPFRFIDSTASSRGEVLY